MAINKLKCLKNFTFKATKFVRYQFYLCFILGFLITRNKIQIILFNRKKVFIKISAYYIKTILLVYWIAITVFANNIK